MTYHWFNGQLHRGASLALGINEPAFLYGATVFTTLRVYGHSLAHPLTSWAAHQARLTQTLQAFRWPAPSWHQVRQGAEALLQDYPILRITCFPDGRELVTGRSLPPDLDQIQAQGITAWVAEDNLYRRSHPGDKTGNYLGAWLALQAAQGHQAREAILVNSQGQWLETSTGNLWGYAEGQWHTPSLDLGLLPGIVRQQVIDHLLHQGDSVKEQVWTAEQVAAFETLAYSNSGVQVVPIHTVLGDRSRLEFNPQHPSLEALRAVFREY